MIYGFRLFSIHAKNKNVKPRKSNKQNSFYFSKKDVKETFILLFEVEFQLE